MKNPIQIQNEFIYFTNYTEAVYVVDNNHLLCLLALYVRRIKFESRSGQRTF